MNITKYQITDELKERLSVIKRKYNLEQKWISNINKVCKEIRKDLVEEFGKLNNMNSFGLMCLLYCNDMEDFEDWDEVNTYLKKSRKIGYYMNENGYSCCCGKCNIRKVIKVNIDSNDIIMGNSCCEKYKIITKQQLKMIKKKQEKNKKYQKEKKEKKEKKKVDFKCCKCKIKISEKQYGYGRKCYECIMKGKKSRTF